MTKPKSKVGVKVAYCPREWELTLIIYYCCREGSFTTHIYENVRYIDLCRVLSSDLFVYLFTYLFI